MQSKKSLPPIAWNSPTLWGLLIIHLVGFSGLVLAAVGVIKVNTTIWIAAFVLAVFRGLAIGAGYHRYFAHRTFKFTRWERLSQFLLAAWGSSAAQGGVIYWSGTHRDHHRFTDQEGDPHSPKLHGYWWAHMGWMFRKQHVVASNVSDLTRYPELVWMQKWHFLFPALLALICWLWLGVAGVLIVFGVGTVLLYQATFLVNSAAHSTKNAKDTSRNIWWMTLFMPVGEAWHANHHRAPNSARSGEKWWQVDLSYNLLQLLALLRHIRFNRAST